MQKGQQETPGVRLSREDSGGGQPVDKGDQRVRPNCLPVGTTHPAQAHAAAALLQVQGLQQLLHRLQGERSLS